MEPDALVGANATWVSQGMARWKGIDVIRMNTDNITIKSPPKQAEYLGE